MPFIQSTLIKKYEFAKEDIYAAYPPRIKEKKQANKIANKYLERIQNTKSKVQLSTYYMHHTNGKNDKNIFSHLIMALPLYTI